MYKKYFPFILLFLLTAISCYSQKSFGNSVEVRAVWLTTNWGLDWPMLNKPEENQKQELIKILDQLAAANFNTVLFQTRIRGDVFYKSRIEQQSPFMKNMSRSDFDPLAFVVQECHKRGLECHAWFVTFPVGSTKQVTAQGRTSVVYKHRNLCKLYRGEWYLDPGNPEARKYILSLVDEIVENYDIDGIHFDYIRYPENDRTFPDKDTYKKYSENIPLADWRRGNITKLVSDIYESVKKQKNWVQVSSSPIGRYRPLSEKPNDGWTAYEDVFQDAGYWLEKGIHDAIFPMMYYKDNLFYPYLEDWLHFRSNRLVIPGLGAYLMSPTEKDWSVNDVLNQVDFARNHHSNGIAFYRTSNILDDTKGILSSLKLDYFQYPAKLPPLTWLDNQSPTPPIDLEVFKTEAGLTCIRWQPSKKDEDLTYTVYTSFTDSFDLNNPQLIVSTGLRQNEIYLKVEDCNMGMYYTVTASDRYHNESQPCESAFFIHSSLIK
ncbi:MAG: glycoside hydrolase family 10 protein [Dysgonomonas sp.]